MTQVKSVGCLNVVEIQMICNLHVRKSL